MRTIVRSIGIIAALAIIIAITSSDISTMQASALICTHPSASASCSGEGAAVNGYSYGHEHDQVTILKAHNKGSASGFDNQQSQEASN
jgi:hypothetical protein